MTTDWSMSHPPPAWWGRLLGQYTSITFANIPPGNAQSPSGVMAFEHAQAGSTRRSSWADLDEDPAAVRPGPLVVKGPGPAGGRGRALPRPASTPSCCPTTAIRASSTVRWHPLAGAARRAGRGRAGLRGARSTRMHPAGRRHRGRPRACRRPSGTPGRTALPLRPRAPAGETRRQQDRHRPAGRRAAPGDASRSASPRSVQLRREGRDLVRQPAAPQPVPHHEARV